MSPLLKIHGVIKMTILFLSKKKDDYFKLLSVNFTYCGA